MSPGKVEAILAAGARYCSDDRRLCGLCRREATGGRSLVGAGGGAAGEGGGTFVWVGVFEPSEAEFKAVAAEFGLHELAVEDAVRAHQRPKLEAYGETIHVVVKTGALRRPEGGDRRRRALDLRRFGLCDHRPPRRGRPLAPVRERLEARPDLLRNGPGAVLYAIVDHVVDRYIEAAQGFDEDVREVELQVFGEGQNPTQRIYKLEREVLEFQAAATPLGEALEELCSGNFAVDPERAARVLPRRRRSPAPGHRPGSRTSASCSTARWKRT